MALSDSNVDDTMAEDWKTIQGKYALEEGEGETGGGETEIARETEQTQESSTSPAGGRNKDGTFAKVTKESPDGQSKQEKEGQSGKASKTASAEGRSDQTQGRPQNSNGTGGPETGVGEAADGGSRSDTNRAPSSWKPAERAEYATLSPVVKAAIHRRESEMAAGAQQLVPDAQFGRSIRSAVEPYRMLIEAEGGTPERAIGQLLKTAALFRVGTNEQKAQAIAGLVQQFGIDMRVLVPQGQQPNGQTPPQQFRDPRFDQFLANQQREAAAATQREQHALEQTVDQWMSEVDENGAPVRPYLPDVIQEMSAMLPQIKASNPALTNAQALEEAYKRAIWANPEVRTVLQREAAAASGAQTQAANQTRVREARRAASVNVPRRASIPTPAKPGAMEDTIAATARELGLIT